MMSRCGLLMLAMLILVSLAAGALWPVTAQGPEGSPGTSSPQDSPWNPSGPAPQGEFEPGEVVVKFKDDLPTASVASLEDRYGATRVRSSYSSDAELWLVDAGRELEIIEELQTDPWVEYAEPNYVYHAFVTPNDPYLNRQWAHSLIKSLPAWDITTGSADVIIAIVDTGIDESHPDLQSKIVAGYDFVDGDDDPHDLHGHGTHCAGVAAAVTNNGVGVAGLNWQARIMPVRALGYDGQGNDWDIAQGIRWAAQHGAKVISLSLGGPLPSQFLQDAVNDAYAAGSLVVAAMGNYRLAGNPTMYPAAYNKVMAVAATGPTDGYASYSQYGPHCDISAPGGDMVSYHDPAGIYSTMPTYPVYMTTVDSYYGGYDYANGTSQATPYVAGLAALVWAMDGTLTPDQVQNAIKTTADDLGAPGWDPNYGYGRINALAALQAISAPATPTLLPIDNPDGDGTYLVDWNTVARASSYTLQEDDGPSFSSPKELYRGTDSRFLVQGQGGGTWYYRVLAANNAGNSPWSAVQSATVKPSAPVLDPIDNGGNDDEYEVSWAPAAGATGYMLEEADNPSFISPRTRYAGAALQYRVTGQPGGTWYYRVRARNSAGDSPWSGIRSTSVDPAALDAPYLFEIDNADGDGSYQVTWTAVTNATGYVLEASRDPYFSDPAEVYSGVAPAFSVVAQSGGVWSYRVRALGPAGRSPWGNHQQVTVIARVYLPLVAKNSVVGGGLVNGNFELGPVVWTQYSFHQWQLIADSGFPSPVVPHSGRWAVWFGRDSNEIAYIQQQVTVPVEKPHLAYWHWIESEDLCGYYFDAATIAIDGSSVDRYDLCKEHNTGGWVEHSVDLSVYAGESVSLQIRVKTDGSFDSNLFLDDVSFRAIPVAAAGVR